MSIDTLPPTGSVNPDDSRRPGDSTDEIKAGQGILFPSYDPNSVDDIKAAINGGTEASADITASPNPVDIHAATKKADLLEATPTSTATVTPKESLRDRWNRLPTIKKIGLISLPGLLLAGGVSVPVASAVTGGHSGHENSQPGNTNTGTGDKTGTSANHNGSGQTGETVDPNLIVSPPWSNAYPTSVSIGEMNVALSGPIGQQQFNAMTKGKGAEWSTLLEEPGMSDFYQNSTMGNPSDPAAIEQIVQKDYAQLTAIAGVVGKELPFSDVNFAKKTLFDNTEWPQGATEGQLEAAVAQGPDDEDHAAVSSFLVDALKFNSGDRVDAAITVYSRTLEKDGLEAAQKTLPTLKAFITAGQLISDNGPSPLDVFQGQVSTQNGYFHQDPAAYKAVSPKIQPEDVVSAEMLKGQVSEVSPGLSTAMVKVTEDAADPASGIVYETDYLENVTFVTVPGPNGSKQIIGLVQGKTQIPGSSRQISGQQ